MEKLHELKTTDENLPQFVEIRQSTLTKTDTVETQ